MPEQIEPLAEALPAETTELTYTIDGEEVTVAVTSPPEVLYYRVDRATNRFLHITQISNEFTEDPADMYSYGEYDTSGPNKMLTYYLLGKFIRNIESEELAKLVTRVIIKVNTNSEGELELSTSLRPKAVQPPEPDEYIPPDPALAEAE